MTYTVEIESDYTHIVVLDSTGADNDLTIDICDNSDVYLRQECLETGKVDLILITYSMLVDLSSSLGSEEGMFETELIKKENDND